MKTLRYLIVMAILVIAGCAQDDTMFENQENMELKKAKVPVPFKADCFAVADIESDKVPVEGLEGYWAYSKLIVSGTGTHLGKINAEKSFYTLEKLVFFIDDDGLPYTLNTGKGVVVGANGDGFELTFTVKQSFDENDSYTGTLDIIPGSGTGKFKGCSGSSDIVGASDNATGGTWFKIDGYLVYE